MQGLPQMFPGVIVTVLLGMLAAALAAGAVQVVAGRSDGRRGHLFLSAALWGTLLTGAGILHLALSWAFQTAPADIEFSQGSVVGAPQGRYFALTSFDSRGRLGYHPTFLVDAGSARFVRVPAMERLAFAEQGHMAAWLCSGRQRALCVAQLDATSPRVGTVVLAAGVADSDYPWILAISAEGDRLLLKDASGVAVVETSTGRLVARASVLQVSKGYFDSADVVRLHRQVEPRPGAETILLEWSLRTGQARETGRFGDAAWAVHRQGGHLLVPTIQGGLDIRDGVTGRVEHSLLPASRGAPGPQRGWRIQPQFLGDGRVAAILTERNADRLKVFGANGNPDIDVLIGDGHLLLAGESAPGELVLNDWTAGFLTLFVDATTGEIRKKESGIRPAAWRSIGSDLQRESAPGSLDTRLFITPDGVLVDRDPVTGVRRVLIQGHKHQEE